MLLPLTIRYTATNEHTLCCYHRPYAMLLPLTIRYAATRLSLLAPPAPSKAAAVQVPYAISLRASYPLSCTDMAYAGICLRACYETSGTDMAYGGICELRDVRY
eukprot:277998-Rhodomonas_salina.2